MTTLFIFLGLACLVPFLVAVAVISFEVRANCPSGGVRKWLQESGHAWKNHELSEEIDDSLREISLTELLMTQDVVHSELQVERKV